MSQLTVLSGVLGGAATTAYGTRKEKRVSIDSDRLILNKIRSTPKSPFTAFFPNFLVTFFSSARQIKQIHLP
jgi:hypothetical protein